MTTTEFINEIIDIAAKVDKEGLIAAVKKHVTCEYLPISEKIAKCELIVNSTERAKLDDETEVYRLNSPARFILYTLVMIDSYTDIEIDFKDSTGEFDLLSENRLTPIILNCIPKDELESFQMIMNMVKEDSYYNERDLVSWIDGKVDALGVILEKAMALGDNKRIEE